MPTVHFVGEIESGRVDRSVFSQLTISTSWAIVCGNAAWGLREGESSGETQSSVQGDDGNAYFNHPIDIQYDTSSCEGWPFLVCEVWDRTHDNKHREFLGCGAVHLPSSAGYHALDMMIWKPTLQQGELSGVAESLLAGVPDVKYLRELIVKPYLRSQVQTDTIGSIIVTINTITNGFGKHGVGF